MAKLDSKGKWLWAKRAGSSDYDAGGGVALDAQGNVFVTGGFASAADFGNTTLTSKGSRNIFVAKLDSKGKWLWAKRAGSKGYGTGVGIVVSTQNDVFVVGEFNKIADFGSAKLTSQGKHDLFLAKLDKNGKWLWAKRVGSSDYDEGHHIVIDKQNDIVITGAFSKTADFGSMKLTSKGKYDLFVAKLDSKGKWLWAKRAGSSVNDGGFGLAVDTQDNILITGEFQKTADFENTKLTSKGYTDVFVWKLKPNP